MNFLFFYFVFLLGTYELDLAVGTYELDLAVGTYALDLTAVRNAALCPLTLAASRAQTSKSLLSKL